MISISGVRGVYGDGLDDETVEKFACAFGSLYQGTVVVGRDSRLSGGALSGVVARRALDCLRIDTIGRFRYLQEAC